MSEPKIKRAKIASVVGSSSTVTSEDFNNPYGVKWDDSDIIFVIGKDEFHCHSTVLMLASPVFQAMFQNNYKEGKERKAELPGKDRRMFKLFLDFIYQFIRVDYDMPTDRKILRKVLEYAHEYNVNCVKQNIDYVLLSKVYAKADVAKSTELALEDLRLSEKYELKEVRRCTLEILIKENHLTSYDHALFNDLSGDTKFSIIKGKLKGYLPSLSKKERGSNTWNLLADIVNIKQSPRKHQSSDEYTSEDSSDSEGW